MKRLLFFTFTVTTLFIFFSCQKELSFELKNTPAQGSLQSDASDECLPKTVAGSYVARKVLNDSNFIEIDINISKAGTYTISTDTVNGYSFHGTGNLAAPGVNSVKLKGQGTPTSAGTNTFLISFDSTFCYVQVTVLPAGAGGPAVFTLQGSGATCLDYNIQGTYVVGTLLTASNKVDIKVDVTTIGTYSISTTATNGMTFSGTGTFGGPGIQIVTLNGSGTPVTAGSTTVTITAGATSCTFDVTVSAIPPPLLNDYFPRTTNSNWSYEWNDDPTDTLLQKASSLTISALGNTYNVFIGTLDASMGFDTLGYYRKSGGDYYQYLEMGGYLGQDSNSVWMEFIFLKDNQPAGTAWNSNQFIIMQNGSLYTIRIALSVLQKDVSATVNGQTYSNTIVIQEKYEIFAGGVWNDLSAAGFGYYKNYYAKGVGLIKWEWYDPTNVPGTKLELTRYNVY